LFSLKAHRTICFVAIDEPLNYIWLLQRDNTVACLYHDNLIQGVPPQPKTATIAEVTQWHCKFHSFFECLTTTAQHLHASATGTTDNQKDMLVSYLNWQLI